MILSDIRYIVGIHLGEKGLPPSVIAPVINILNLVDQELSVAGFELGPEVEKELERLKNSIVLWNFDGKDEEDSIDFEDEVNKVLKSDVDASDDDDLSFLDDED
jgi:hypothetical protein